MTVDIFNSWSNEDRLCKEQLMSVFYRTGIFIFFHVSVMTWISGFLFYISKAAQYRECLVTKLQKEKMQKNKTDPC